MNTSLKIPFVCFFVSVNYPVIHVNFQPRQKFLNSLPPVQVKGSRRFQRKSESYSAGLSAASTSFSSSSSSAAKASEFKDPARAKKQRELPSVSRLLTEDALGPSVHVQQGKLSAKLHLYLEASE